MIIGNKAEGLVFLNKHKFLVPKFFVINFDDISLLLNDEIQVETLISKLNISEQSLWAVRSSADAEDGKDKSFAGLFKTLINVSSQNLNKAVLEVLNSYAEVLKLEYTNVSKFKFGIIIQKMLKPDYSGVIFSQNPLDISDKSIIVNIVPGLGEELVSGRVEAFSVKKINRKIEYLNEEDNFVGKTFTNKYNDISKTGIEIKTEIKPYIKELFSSAKKISKLKKYPADIEFAIANNQIYFLQVRPITTINNSEEKILSVWDNSNITENYPDLSMPLTISFVQYTYLRGYTLMSEFLGMNRKLIEKNNKYLSEMAGGINGAMYYNITSWQKQLYQMPFGRKTSKHITKILGMEQAEFKKPKNKASILGYLRLLTNLLISFFNFNKLKKSYLDNFEKVMQEFNSINLINKNHNELVENFKVFDKKMGDNWIAPMLNGFFAMILFALLKKVVRNSVLREKYPNFSNDVLFSSGDVISVKIVRELQKILATISNNKELFTLFRNNEISKIKLEIEKFTYLKLLINNYIENYGERSEIGELKIETVNYKENPDAFLEFLKNNIFEGSVKQLEVEKFNYKKIIKINYRYKPLRRVLFLKLIKYTVERIKDRENFRFIRTKTFSLVRKIFRAIDYYLLQNNYIENKNDSQFLYKDEILNTEKASVFKEIIAKRKAEYETFKKVKRANRYHKTNKGFIPIEIIIASNIDGIIKGVGCSSGTIVGEVVVIDEFTDSNNDFTGKILVANYFEPGKINYFSQATGLISQRGNLLSHTAILSRELGLPAIVGAKGILTQIKTGHTVQMNGATGEIKILNNSDE